MDKFEDEMMTFGDWTFKDAEDPLPYEKYPFVLFDTFYEIKGKGKNTKGEKG